MYRILNMAIAFLTVPSVNPLEISNDNNYPSSGRFSVFGLLGLKDLYSIFLSVVLMAAVITITASLATLMITRKKDKRAEIKDDIIHKLVLVFLAASAVTIFDVLLLIGRMFTG